MHDHMYMRTHAGLLWTQFFITTLALYSSVNTVLVEVDRVGWSPFISRIAHKRLTSFGGHGQQQRFYVSQPQRRDPRCWSFLARSSILTLWLGSKYFRKHGSLEYSCRLSTSQSLHSQIRRASVRHALKALRYATA